VRARLDRRRYPTGKKVSAKELRELTIERDDFHGDWNYVIKPRKEMR
jgi:Rhodopirellula transposase DDE domain